MNVITKHKDYEPSEINLALRWLVTARLNKKTPIHDWYVYPHSYARELVHFVLDEFKVGPGSIVLDPCVGAGSTVLSCRERKISAIGYDLLPLSVLITNVKTRDYDVESLEKNWKALLSNGLRNQRVEKWPEMAFFSGAFDNRVLERILQTRDSILRVDNPEHREFFLLGLIAILENLSKTAKGGGWLRWRTNNTSSQNDVDILFQARINKMINDLKSPSIVSPHFGTWKAKEADARNLPGENQYDAVVTSPPYLNRHDYTRIFLLELVIPFLLNEHELKDLRYKSLRSHVEAKQQNIDKQKYEQPDKLVKIMDEIKSMLVNNPRVPEMIAGYFEDIFLMLREISRLTKKGAGVAFVLGNVRFSGMMIPVDEITAEIGEQAGLTWNKTVVARLRGNSAQQMGKYGKELSRESLILWQK
ncbi:MAG: hypothetical protein JXA46_12280 [Dehalococcoidales bacterium]|nr:hypothetical protein [Dehalococcoidales bacterium]